MGNWSTYFSITESIAAGLCGLLFIALSMNIKQILSITKSKLPSRAVGSLVLLGNITIVSNLCLVPEQPIFWLGLEIFLLGLILWIPTARLDLLIYHTVEDLYKKAYLRNLFFLHFSILPFLLAGIILMYGSNTGYYILVPGIIISLIKALLDVWYLTVEINK